MVFSTWKTTYKELDTVNVPWAVVFKKTKTKTNSNLQTTQPSCQVQFYVGSHGIQSKKKKAD